MKIVQNGSDELGWNATEVQRIAHKELKKKDCKAFLRLQNQWKLGIYLTNIS